MKISIENLGPLKHADFEMGDLTLVCGENNTGKTYLNYAVYGFLTHWKVLMSYPIEDSDVDSLMKTGSLRLSLDRFLPHWQAIVSRACTDYLKRLPAVLSAASGSLKDCRFELIPRLDQDVLVNQKIEMRLGSMQGKDIIAIHKQSGERDLEITVLTDPKQPVKQSPHLIRYIITDALNEFLFAPLIPVPWIASVERTGCLMFYRKIVQTDPYGYEDGLVREKNDREYEQEDVHKPGIFPKPIEDNIEFYNDIPKMIKSVSPLATDHPDILRDFMDILGGDMLLSDTGEMNFVPTGSRTRLSVNASSSSVRSLLYLNYYLKHIATPGQLLIIDEPELNLHPQNQRRLARLLVRLIHAGIKVLISTHSDYIVKEINTLIMLNQDKPHIAEIMKEEGYSEKEKLASDMVKLYMIRTVSNDEKEAGLTLVTAPIDPEYGIEAVSFDEAIDEMNRIQDAIVWGGE